VHRTVRCATGQCPVPRAVRLQTCHLQVSKAALHYNSPDCPVYQRSNDYLAQRSSAKAWTMSEQCAKKSERTSEAHRTVNSTCPVPHRTVRCRTGLSGAAPDCPVRHEVSVPMVRIFRTLTVGWRGWRTGQCPVRPSTDSLPNGYVVVEGYKYPQPPHSKHPSFLDIPFNTRASAINTRHNSKESKPLQVPNSLQTPND
jgi:hypothetical protein